MAHLHKQSASKSLVSTTRVGYSTPSFLRDQLATYPKTNMCMMCQGVPDLPVNLGVLFEPQTRTIASATSSYSSVGYIGQVSTDQSCPCLGTFLPVWSLSCSEKKRKFRCPNGLVTGTTTLPLLTLSSEYVFHDGTCKMSTSTQGKLRNKKLGFLRRCHSCQNTARAGHLWMMIDDR